MSGARNRSVIDNEQTLALYRSLRDAQMWVIPGGDHVPIYDAKVPFVTVTLAFLSAR